MNAYSTAAALAVAAAATIAFGAQTQGQTSPESHLAPNAAYSSYDHQGSADLAPHSLSGAKSEAPSCQVERKAMEETAASTAFAATAAQDGMVEVALAGLVLRKSNDTQLREFAQKVVGDYAQSNWRLDSIVKCEGLVLPVELDAKHIALIKKLNAKSGRAFEKAYLKHLTAKHSEAMALLEAASSSGDPDLAVFARKGLSMLQEHRLLAGDLRVAIGTKVVDAR